MMNANVAEYSGGRAGRDGGLRFEDNPGRSHDKPNDCKAVCGGIQSVALP
jgi:hypothetical protein